MDRFGLFRLIALRSSEHHGDRAGSGFRGAAPFRVFRVFRGYPGFCFLTTKHTKHTKRSGVPGAERRTMRRTEVALCTSAATPLASPWPLLGGLGRSTAVFPSLL